MVQLMPLPPPSSLDSLKSRMVLTFLVPAYPGWPGKEAVKLASVCLDTIVSQRVLRWILVLQS